MGISKFSSPRRVQELYLLVVDVCMEALVVSAFRADIGKSKQGYVINVHDSIRALVELGLDVHVLAFGSHEPEIPGVTRHLIPMRGSRASIDAFRCRFALYKEFSKLKFDLLYVHHSPDFPSRILLRRKARYRILHLHDLLSDVALSMYGLFGAILSLIYSVDETLSAKYTDLAIVPSELMGEIVRDKGYQRVGVAYNRPGPVEPKETDLAELIKSLKRPIFVYIGTIQPRIRGLEEILGFIESLGGTFVAIGKKEAQLPKGVVYHPPVPRDELIGAIRYADFGVLGKTLYYALPAKIFDYMYAGLPILTSRQNQAIIKLLQKANRPYVFYDEPSSIRVERPKGFPSWIKPRKKMIKELIRALIE